jgi:CDP-diacylglycerol--glycerol-3-phosphate 3-phosphatidyltransferase
MCETYPGQIPLSLRLQWRKTCVFCVASVLGGFGLLRSLWQAEYAWCWLVPATFGLVYTLGLVRQHLPQNHRKQSALILPTLGAGTGVTIGRGVLISLLAGFVGLPWLRTSVGTPEGLRWMPGGLYLAAVCADYLDGYLARVTDHETRLGEILDTKLDAFGVCVASLVAVGASQLPWYYLVAGCAYYLLQAAIWIRKRTGKPVHDIAPWAGARLLAGFQMGLIAVALLPVFGPPVTTIAAIIGMIPFLAGFGKDWLVVCGRFPTEHPWQRSVHKVLTRLLPPVVRLLLGGAGFSVVWRTPSSQQFVWSGLIVVAVVMLLGGIIGRLAAFGLSLTTAWGIMEHRLYLDLFVLFAGSLILMLSGTGAFSLWQPEDRVLFRRAGERPAGGGATA